jgi:hypothetical protein
MPQDRSRYRKQGGMVNARAGSSCAKHTVAVTVLAVLAVSLAAVPSRAQNPGDSPFTSLLRKMGLGKGSEPDSNIDYSERPPLVVPPTRDLPPPSAGPPTAADWPVNDQRKHAKVKPKAPPDNAPPVMDNHNPPYEKKVWYNPATWFNKVEYGPFTGEPPRAQLTDPPVGYRTPSPDQPYGIGPDDKKGRKKIGTDGTPVQTSTTAPAAAPQASTTQGSAPAQTTAQASAATAPAAAPPAGQSPAQAGR